MSVSAPAPTGKLVHPKHIQRWAHRQKTILRNTYDQAWGQGVNGYITDYGPDLSTADATDPVTGLAPGEDDLGDFADAPPDVSQQPAQQQDSWLHQQLIDQVTPTGRIKDQFTPTGRAEDKLLDSLKDRLLPDPMRRALALHPSLSSVNNMAANMAALQKTGTPEGDRQALLDYIDNNGWRIDPGESTAWAGEQNGYAEAAATDNQLLEWQTSDDDRVCPDCEALGGFPPQALADWPSQPGDGSTQCNVGCRCSFSVVPIEIQPGDIYAPQLSEDQQGLVNTLLDKQAQTLADSATEAAYLDGTTMQESSAWRLAEYDDAEPRDYHGRWTDGGGSGDANVASLIKSLEAGNHTEVSAADAPKLVASLASSPTPVELENLHIDGAGHDNLFDRSATNIPRADMPQVPGDAQHVAEFQQALAREGIGYAMQDVSPLDLRATQDQLDGRTVGKIFAHYDPSRAGVLMVSRDGDVLDGHHRWGADAMQALVHPGFTVPVMRMDAPIGKLIDIAQRFDVQTGIAHEGFGQPSK